MPGPDAQLLALRLVRRARRGAVRIMFSTLMAVLRPVRIAVVYGAPDFEENSLVTTARLTGAYTGRVVLLCADPEATRRYLTHVGARLGIDTSRVELVTKRQWANLRLVASAELLFYTHGLFFSPRPRGRRLHVNLWHGTGPKSSALRQFASSYHPSAHSAASRPWGEATVRALRMLPGTPVIPGNARSDLLIAPTDRAAALRSLGLDPDRPIVLWVPTYRRTDAISLRQVEEGISLLSVHGGDLAPADLAAAADSAGVTLLLKPHPSDQDRLGALGLPVVTSDQLWAAGLSFGELMDLSAAVLSDYSSAWVDWLGLRRPLALFCPDLREYVAERGLNAPPLDEIGAELMIDSPAGAAEFFGAIAAGQPFRGEALARLAEVLEVAPADGHRSEQLLVAVRDLARSRFGNDLGLSGA
jgi:hypothetical protein